MKVRVVLKQDVRAPSDNGWYSSVIGASVLVEGMTAAVYDQAGGVAFQVPLDNVLLIERLEETT